MLKLIISQKGLLLNLPGTAPTRTPAEIRISPENLNEAISYLEVSGVEDYKVVSVVDTLKKTKISTKIRGQGDNKKSTLELTLLQLFRE